MTSNDTARRRNLLRAIIAHAELTGDVATPWSLLPELGEHFRTDSEVLVALHGEWLRALVSQLHRGEIVPRRSPLSVQGIYADVAAANPALRAILDAHGDDKPLRAAARREYAMLARLAMPVGQPEPACPASSPETADAEAAGSDSMASAALALLSSGLPFQRRATAWTGR